MRAAAVGGIKSKTLPQVVGVQIGLSPASGVVADVHSKRTRGQDKVPGQRTRKCKRCKRNDWPEATHCEGRTNKGENACEFFFLMISHFDEDNTYL